MRAPCYDKKESEMCFITYRQHLWHDTNKKLSAPKRKVRAHQQRYSKSEEYKWIICDDRKMVIFNLDRRVATQTFHALSASGSS